METSRHLCARVASEKQKETTSSFVQNHSQLLKATEDDAEQSGQVHKTIARSEGQPNGQANDLEYHEANMANNLQVQQNEPNDR